MAKKYKVLRFKDFDGTLVYTPGPDRIYNGMAATEFYDKWLAENNLPKRKWTGWWGRTETLMPPLFGEINEQNQWVVPEHLLNKELAALHAEHVADEDSLNILATGRHFKMRHPNTKEHVVKEILDRYGLKFDRYYYVATGCPTLTFKCNLIESLLQEFDTIRHVEIWEDREQHTSKFWELVKWLKKQGRLEGGHVYQIPMYQEAVPQGSAA
jgi:hypothetical protein